VTKNQFAGKAKPPTITVKAGAALGRVGWVVRMDGAVVDCYEPVPDSGEAHRRALRHRDKLLAEWKEAQRAKVLRRGT
jgi:hypothetical protein